MVELIAEIIMKLTGYYFNPQKKLQKNIDLLKHDPWFAELENDFRYNHLIWNNRKVMRYLALESNVGKLLKDEDEKREFKKLLKQEHLKFITSH